MNRNTNHARQRMLKLLEAQLKTRALEGGGGVAKQEEEGSKVVSGKGEHKDNRKIRGMNT